MIKLAGPLKKPETFALHPDDRAAIEHEAHEFEDPRAATIEALKIVQKRHGGYRTAPLPQSPPCSAFPLPTSRVWPPSTA